MNSEELNRRIAELEAEAAEKVRVIRRRFGRCDPIELPPGKEDVEDLQEAIREFRAWEAGEGRCSHPTWRADSDDTRCGECGMTASEIRQAQQREREE